MQSKGVVLDILLSLFFLVLTFYLFKLSKSTDYHVKKQLLFLGFIYSRDCPADLKEGISSLLFAGPRCSEIPELLGIRDVFEKKYGKDFVSAATDLRPNAGVNRMVITCIINCLCFFNSVQTSLVGDAIMSLVLFFSAHLRHTTP